MAATGVTATTAILHGVLNPKATGEAGSYELLYRASESECKGAGEVKTIEGLSLGGGKEEVAQAIETLAANTQYTVCVVAHNEAKTEEAVSLPVTFKTALPPETPETKPATEATATSWNLHGVLNPKAPGDPGTYQFRYRAAASECEGEGEARAPEPAGAALGSETEVVSTPLTGLLPTTTYTFCLRAENGAGEAAVGQPETFTTPVAPPTVTAQAASSLVATEVTLTAQIDPGGGPTTYDVEYEPGKRTAEQALPASKTPVGVQQKLTGLNPATEYHVRFLAHNSAGPAEGTLLAFTTPSSGGPSALTLPDSRVYELVSSPTANQDVYVPQEEGAGKEDFNTERAVRASADGDAVAYLGEPPSAVEGEGAGLEGNGLGNAWLSTRGPEGWRPQSIQPTGTGESEGQGEYLDFSDGLTSAVFSSSKALGADVATNCELYSDTIDAHNFRPLATAAQATGPCTTGELHLEIFAGGSADESHLLFENGGALAAGASEAASGQFNLYDSTAGQPHLVNVLANGAPLPNPTFGGPAFPALTGGEHHPDVSNAISADGSHIFWTALETLENEQGKPVEQPKTLYARINDTQPMSPLDGNGECTVATDACTVQVDAGEPQCVSEGKCASGGGRFWTASRDGSKVFFTDCRKLTAQSTAVFNSGLGCAREGGSAGEALLVGNDLYEYDFAKPAGERLADLTVDQNAGDPLRADVQGVVAINETGEAGSDVYFVAGGALAEGATARTCKAAEDTEGKELEEFHEEEQGRLPSTRGCNLYLRTAGQPLRFIAVLSPKDDNLKANKGSEPRFFGDWRSALDFRMAEATPDGRQLLFRSYQPLTGYDSREARPEGRALPEVFVYDASTGRVSCASCNPTGARPRTELEPFGGYVPPGGRYVYNYMPRWISEDGSRVFFDSRDSLVPQATNIRNPEEEEGRKFTEGRQDVYEWEREGAPSCPEKSPARPNGGCVFLLSGGSSTDDSFLIDSSADGSDVFFVSRAPLVPEAVNENMKLYDARVGGGFPKPTLACTGTGCQGVPPAPPIFTTPSSATFNGVGNFPPPPAAKAKTPAQIRAEQLARALKSCHKKKNKHKRAICEAQAKRRYGPLHKAKKSNRPGRAGKASHKQRGKR
jgi:hypothetical protein